MSRIRELIALIERAQNELNEELAKAHPGGSTVKYRLRAGQPVKEATVVRVIGGPEGRLILRLPPNPRSVMDEPEGHETSLPYSKIVDSQGGDGDKS